MNNSARLLVVLTEDTELLLEQDLVVLQFGELVKLFRFLLYKQCWGGGGGGEGIGLKF